MYNGYFGFARRPFPSAPLVDLYFPATAIENARQTLARCIERAEGAALVVGPSGTGKTLLCRVLAAQFRDSLRVAVLSSGRLGTRRSLFQAILYELGQGYRGMDEGESRLALVDYLTTSDDCAAGMLLLVDEAHSLPLRLFEELRMLTNVVRDAQPQVRLVMAGGCVLEERFAHPRLDSFSQRLVARCYLEPLNRTETQHYVHALVHTAGAAAETVFSEDACKSLYQATDGVPRLINQVCDHALLLAYAAGRRELVAAQIEEAWADLQQLPTPWNEDRGDADAGVIEFGGLEDPSDDEEPSDELAVSVPSLHVLSDGDELGATADEPAERIKRIEEAIGSVQHDYEPAGSIGPELELVFEDPFDEEFENEEVVADRFSAASEPAGNAGGTAAQPVASTRQETPTLSPTETESQPLPMYSEQAAEQREDPDIAAVEQEDYDHLAAVGGAAVAVRSREFGRLFTKLRRR